MDFVRRACLILLLFNAASTLWASETAAEHIANVYEARELAATPLHENLPDFSLPPAKLAKAQHLSRVGVVMHFLGTAWDIAQALLLLGLGAIGWMRDRAVAAGSLLRQRGWTIGPRLAEGFTFAFLFSGAGTLLGLPMGVYGHWLSRSYGLSVEGWWEWLADAGKEFGIGWLQTAVAFLLLAETIRRFPKRWWVACWAVFTPVILFMTYLAPLVIDPMFNRFEPLQKTQPELVARLEQVVAKGHMNIPPERMFLMRASEKTTEMNAYVTGFGGSKRLVLWDTMLAKATPDELLVVFGHESGHYVLGHVTQGILSTVAGLFAVLYLGYRFAGWSIDRFGARWRIPSLNDWGALAVLMLTLSIFTAVTEPVKNALSRANEHAADVYGQEAVHGIVTDPQSAAQGLNQVVGENSLADPNPGPLVEFWLYNHPAIGRRAAFSKAYEPWAAGLSPKYFPPDDVSSHAASATGD